MAGAFSVVAATELRVLWRNRTAAVTAVLVPLALGCFWGVTFHAHNARQWAMAIALQLVVAMAFSVYGTTTATVVTRRQTLVLKRLRTSDASDRAILAGLVTPGAGLSVLQLVVFLAVDIATGAPAPADPVPLVLAVLLGLAFCVSAAMATTLVTASPERAQISTLPLMFLVLGGAVAMTVLGVGPLTQALTAVPGAGIGQLCALAFRGDTWAPGTAGLPAALPATLSLLVWTALLGWLATRRFRWDRR